MAVGGGGRFCGFTGLAALALVLALALTLTLALGWWSAASVRGEVLGE